MSNAQRVPFAEAKRKPMFWLLLLLTCSRAMIALYGILVVSAWNSWMWLLAAYATEMLDGRLTERFGVRTSVGKKADRISTLVLFCCCAPVVILSSSTNFETTAIFIALATVCLALKFDVHMRKNDAFLTYADMSALARQKNRLTIVYDFVALPFAVLFPCLDRIAQKHRMTLEWYEELVYIAVVIVVLNVANLVLRSKKVGRLFARPTKGAAERP